MADCPGMKKSSMMSIKTCNNVSIHELSIVGHFWLKFINSNIGKRSLPNIFCEYIIEKQCFLALLSAYAVPILTPLGEIFTCLLGYSILPIIEAKIFFNILVN